MRPMLAETATTANAADKLIRDPNWWASQKVDGHRLIVKITAKQVRYLNRSGNRYQPPINPAIKQMFATTGRWGGQSWTFDGEYLPETGVYWAFDLIDSPITTQETPYFKRHSLLSKLFDKIATDNVRLLPTHQDSEAKATLLLSVHQNGGEGIMFRKADSPYIEGRSSDLVKFKFITTADVEVVALKPEGRRSVSMQVYNPDGEPVPVGSVAVTDSMLDILTPGEVIEVKYMYRGAQGHLYSPRFLRRRTDKSAAECLTTQLKPTNKGVLA